MNKKYIKYIDYIVSDIEAPYFKNIRYHYGLKPNEYEMILSKVYNQPVTIEGGYIYDEQGNIIYFEDNYGNWWKKEYDANGNNIYGENSSGNWYKYEYDEQENIIYYEDSDAYIKDNR